MYVIALVFNELCSKTDYTVAYFSYCCTTTCFFVSVICVYHWHCAVIWHIKVCITATEWRQ